MPHPSSLVDDTGAPSYNREYGRLMAVSRTFGSFVRRAVADAATASQRGERTSDRLLCSYLFCMLVSFMQCLFVFIEFLTVIVTTSVMKDCDVEQHACS